MSAGALPPLSGSGIGGSADDFAVHSLKPDVRFLIKGVQPPSHVYVTTDDDLVVSCASSQTGEAVTVSYRLLRADGQIILGQGVIRPGSNRAATMHSESLCEGFLLSVSCKAAVATTRGQTFVRIFLSNPTLGGGQPSYMLMSDYITTAMAPAFPNGRQLSSVEGPGVPTIYPIPLSIFPVAASITVPTNARWKPLCASWTISTFGGVGNRFASISFQPVFSEVVWQYASDLAIPNGKTFQPVTYGGTAGFNGQLNTNMLAAPFDIKLLPGGQIAFPIIGGLASDEIDGGNFLVEEWIDNG